MLLYLSFGFFLFMLILTYTLPIPKVRGMIGERRVNRALRKSLKNSDYHLFKNVTLPTASGTTQIDHIVVSRHGIFVIETKNMSGWIFGKSTQKTWTQVIYKSKWKFQNPLRQNYAHVRAVADLLGLEDSQVYSIAAFVGSATAKTHLPPNVTWSTRQLVQQIRNVDNVLFDEAQVTRMGAQLSAAMKPRTAKTHRLHVKHVKATQAARSEFSNCPRCGSELTVRAKRTTGDKFMGCTQFPKCWGTRPLLQPVGQSA